MNECKYNSTVRIDTALLERVNEIAALCGVSKTAVINSAIAYALEHAQVETEVKMVEVKTVAFR